ncbi:MAG: AAA family ATPase [Lachnospiraceae bacterium]|nr:AAA family ATPase [Lachnospiraceae bacterium]
MLGICQKCGNTQWDKEVQGNKIICPKCGNCWTFKKLPVFILTGCSGIGKTTTAQELQRMTDQYVVLDMDFLYNIMNHPQSVDDNYNMIEQALSLSKNINQTGKSVVWTCAGNLEKFPRVYSARFFSDIKVLALTASSEVIRKRMMEGRNIEDESWIQGSIDYNEYLRTHNSIEDTKYDKMDCSAETPKEIAEKVLEWLERNR